MPVTVGSVGSVGSVMTVPPAVPVGSVAVSSAQRRVPVGRVAVSAVVYSRAWMAPISMNLGLGPGMALLVSLSAYMS